jgi:hypothetical protein
MIQLSVYKKSTWIYEYFYILKYFLTLTFPLKLNARVVTHIFIEDLTVTVRDIKCNVEFSLVHLHFLYFLYPTWLDFHTFQEKDLKRVFQFALQVMNELEKQPHPLTREATAVLNRLLSISEHVLCWEFTPKVCILKWNII